MAVVFFKLAHKYLTGPHCTHIHSHKKGCCLWASHAKWKFNFINIFSCYLKKIICWIWYCSFVNTTNLASCNLHCAGTPVALFFLLCPVAHSSVGNKDCRVLRNQATFHCTWPVQCRFKKQVYFNMHAFGGRWSVKTRGSVKTSKNK